MHKADRTPPANAERRAALRARLAQLARLESLT